jgi:conjugal transfer pilus assembly protein TraV
MNTTSTSLVQWVASFGKSIQQLGAITAISVLAGCTSVLSGLDAKDSFTCKAGGGVPCESMTTIYNRTQAGTLPAQQAIAVRSSTPAVTSAFHSQASASISVTPNSGQPLRSTPRVVRLWIAPWLDADGDLHDASYVYMSIGQGKWLIDHSQQQIMNTFGPTRAIPKDGTAARLSATKPAGSAQREQADSSSGAGAPQTASPASIADLQKDPAAMEIIRKMMGPAQ